MTKYDIRFRRGQFSNRRISRYKNYDGLMHKHQRTRKRSSIWLLLILLILIMLAFWIGTYYESKTDKKPHQMKQTEQSYLGSHSKINGIT